MLTVFFAVDKSVYNLGVFVGLVVVFVSNACYPHECIVFSHSVVGKSKEKKVVRVAPQDGSYSYYFRPCKSGKLHLRKFCPISRCHKWFSQRG